MSQCCNPLVTADVFYRSWLHDGAAHPTSARTSGSGCILQENLFSSIATAESYDSRDVIQILANMPQETSTVLRFVSVD